MEKEKIKNNKTSTEEDNKNNKEQKEISEVELVEDKEIEEMFKAGLHFGHRHSMIHPKMLPFLYGVRNEIDIIDLLKTKEYLKKALDYLKEKKKGKPLILFVGTKAVARDILRKLAEELQMPYVYERWLGGTLTNFEVIKKRVDYLKEMEEKKTKGEFEKYHKKERMKLDKDLNKLKRKMEGLKKLLRLPDILFAVDVEEERLAINEARKKEIPIVGICDTDGNPNFINYPIPANDDSVASIKYILEIVEKVLI